MLVTVYFHRNLNRPNFKIDKVERVALTDTHIFVHTYYGSVFPFDRSLIRYVSVKCSDGYSYKIQF